ncbi:Uncharacterised protein (plasmid) [Tsukamurella tyrosinosolvens]|uniref:Uncharacterized protein n=1 Tax=Tsukamurella tyrosinosolvens TaxID=57704 RepID=A0A1H4VHT3_TSUTY|nr:hypothetical protein [Tsukamurella tyrosinosolvens]KXO90988.1 hypothetical protein AXK58_21390 [Tsukamurella tyrosinosolvens]SEC79924.1 hypothetical protein SAMN04489793_3216 [Tsukamurella tyrosinosolvens]VEH90542.1 Uncharacterised protein [Tsukamurella tyrosinosolvens]
MRSEDFDHRGLGRRVLEATLDYASTAVSTLAMFALALALIALMTRSAPPAGSPVVVDGSTTPSTSSETQIR